ncbi:DUF1259 domain-containing protein [Fluoribacter dumoffii]|uniref:Domain of Uncharacterized Function (DUF1259) n=1 Tax=Fluoribacter dumoffii TaxID=463 RepID=A0A377ITQ0_9GAMM|nr:DUF1259 domain-containing protein [Fluoribacter dumoffii]KTC89168.1 hypothetical protein Ldum_2844 [Fluoribacter dumoffii NY 23]STO91560.1 Domain of Uncharacterised Function (DUF1259) [Fluoribacter dumoffii]
MIRNITILLFCSCFSISAYSTSEKLSKVGLDPAKIEKITGAKGQLDLKENVFKVSVPRSDLKVTINGVKFTPAMGLTSWAAFKQVDNHVMVMGDLVLTEDQVNPVMSTALANGLNVTALHNHFFWETPRVMFMHIEGMDKADKLADAVGKVFAMMKTTSTETNNLPQADLDPTKTTLDPSKIDIILGEKGILKDGVYKVVFGRNAKMDGYQIGNAMGVNTWAAFVGSDNLAVVDGDFAMHESELQQVLKTLRNAGIYIVAIHQHMTGEQPRFIFLHYYAIGNTETLAKALRAALDITKEQNETK